MPVGFCSPYKILASRSCILQIIGSLSYEQLGHKAFGMVGKLAASGSITMQNIGGKNFLRDDLGRLFALRSRVVTHYFWCHVPHFALVMV